MVDTQAATSLIKLSVIKDKNLINTNEIIYLKGITKEKIPTVGTINLTFIINHNQLPFTVNVIDDRIDIPADGILGDDFLEKHSCDIRYSCMQIEIPINDKIVEIPLEAGPTKEIFAIPARSEVFRIFKIANEGNQVIWNQEISPGVFIPSTIVSSKNPVLKVMNTNSETSLISSNISLKAESLENFHIKTFYLT